MTTRSQMKRPVPSCNSMMYVVHILAATATTQVRITTDTIPLASTLPKGHTRRATIRSEAIPLASTLPEGNTRRAAIPPREYVMVPTDVACSRATPTLDLRPEGKLPAQLPRLIVPGTRAQPLKGSRHPSHSRATRNDTSASRGRRRLGCR